MAEAFSPPLQLSAEGFAAQMAAMNAPHSVAIAVSGGRDSIALARLCAEWSNRTGAKVVALTVDHGLRPEAKKEAEQAKRWCEAMGLAHQTLFWEGEKPTSSLQAAARTARYKLLIAAAAGHGCKALLTAHTMDDQAETVFMRLSRGAGLGGLSAMRDERLVASGAGDVLRLMRPMLGVLREQATGYLQDLGQAYVDDPSNLDDRFERVRVRALLAALYEQDLMCPQALAASARKLAIESDAARRNEELLFDRLGGCFYAWGGASLDRWRSDAPGAAGLACRLLHAVGGGEYPPDAEAAAEAVAGADSGAATLAGALIRRWGERLWIIREPAALLGRAGVAPMAPLAAAGPVLWDRRFIITPDAAGLEIAPLGRAGDAATGAQAGAFSGPPEGLGAAPALYQRDLLIASPALPSLGLETGGFRSLVKERFEGRIIRFP